MGTTVDASFVIDVMRGDAGALAAARRLASTSGPTFLTTPVLYEVTAGLLFTRSRTEAKAFQDLAAGFQLLPFDEPAALRAAEIQAELMRLGRTKAHTDVMIAGIAAAGGHTLVTRDRDFDAMAEGMGLTLLAY